MEIIFKSTEKQSNFQYCSQLFKNKKILNGFNKLEEIMLFEHISDTHFNCQNVSFDTEIIADLILCYPFNVVVKEEIKFKTLYDLISEIRRTYYQIYLEEMQNLKNTNINLYGIWGHSIYDLCISSIKIVENIDKPLVEISIDS